MCIAIYKPQGKTLTKKVLEAAWDFNSHGGGFAYRTDIDGPVTVHKGYFNKKNWVRDITALGATVELIAHARIATHGDRSEANTHPFPLLNNTGAWVHNGVFRGYPSNKKESDTWMFTVEFLDPLITTYADFVWSDLGLKLMDDWFGFNKGIIMVPGRPVMIVNAPIGDEDNGIWFSNTSYKRIGCSRAFANDADWEYDPVRKCQVYRPKAGRIGYSTTPAFQGTQQPVNKRLYDDIDSDDDRHWMQRYDELLEEGESLNDDADTPLSDEEKKIYDQLDEEERLQLEEDRKTIKPVPRLPAPTPSTVWFNGKEYTWEEFKKLDVKIANATKP